MRFIYNQTVMKTALIYDPKYLNHDTGRHPENADRIRVILDALESDQEVWQRLSLVSPGAASYEDVARCHDPRLVERVRNLCERGMPFIDLDTAICPESFDAALLAAGAATTAVDLVMTGQADNVFALVRPPGHHATARSAMGFCLLNNAAIGARYAQAKYFLERVLIIDWDVHHGNGTQEIFYSDPTVFYFSTHQYPYYPGSGSASERGEGKGEGYTLNVPLSAGTPARAHREAFQEALKKIERTFQPDLIIISAGFDSRRGDPLGGLMLEDEDFAEMTKEVLDMADRYAMGRLISILEGGYNLRALGQTVKAHIAALSS